MTDEWTVFGMDDEGEWAVDQVWGERVSAQSWADKHGGHVVRRRVTAWEKPPTCLDDPSSPCRFDEGSHGPRFIHDHPAEVSS